MIRTFTMFAYMVLMSNSLFAQEKVSDERAAMERLEGSIQIVLNMDPQFQAKHLELVDEQKAQLATLNEDYQQIVEELVGLEGDGTAIEIRKKLFVKKMAVLQNRLHSEILLPHQSDVLQSLVFTQFVKHHGGSVLRAIETYYRREFDLDNEQKREMRQIEKGAAERVSAAKERFKKELEKIAKETQQDVRAMLTPEQAKIWDKFQGRK